MYGTCCLVAGVGSPINPGISVRPAATSAQPAFEAPLHRHPRCPSPLIATGVWHCAYAHVGEAQTAPAEWYNAGFGNGPRNDPVHIVQRELSERTDTSLPTLIDALDTIVREQL
jgi:hypothetical protein